MTTENVDYYQNSDICWICDQKIIKDKVRDHCHITGKFRGAGHKECDSKLKIPTKLPNVFHNFEGYDGHLIFRELNDFKDIDIQVIPKSNEKYMSIIVNRNIIFLDSLQFLKASLDNLAGNLQDSDFKHLLSKFLEDKLKLLRKKMHIHMNGLILIKNFFIQDYLQKKVFIYQLMTEKEVKVMGIFLMLIIFT